MKIRLSLTSGYSMHVKTEKGIDIVVCTVGKSVVHYNFSIITDLHTKLKRPSSWMAPGSTDKQKPAKEGSNIPPLWRSSRTDPSF